METRIEYARSRSSMTATEKELFRQNRNLTPFTPGLVRNITYFLEYYLDRDFIDTKGSEGLLPNSPNHFDDGLRELLPSTPYEFDLP